MDELVTLVDEHDNVIGSKKRSELKDHDRWRIVTIWVFNKKGNLLLAKRSHNKRTDPGKWGPSVAGTVEHGESYRLTAERELLEELGVTAPLKELKLLMHESDIGSRANMNFITTIDSPIDSFIPQAEEVDGLQWMPLGQLYKETDISPQKYVKAMNIVKELFGHEQR